MELEIGTWIYDIEADGLNPTKIYCLCASNGKKIYTTSNYNEIKKFFLNAKILIAHNQIRFDIPVVEKLLGIEVTALQVDTLPLSWYLHPERNKHGLAEWGEEFGIKKPPIEDWHNLPQTVYENRCQQDVRINGRLWNEFHSKLARIYGSKDKILDFLKYIEFKMKCARLQEESGWKLDIERCKSSLLELEEIKRQKIDHLSSVMPKIPVYVTKTKPSKMYKKDGSLGSLGQKWVELLIQEGLPDDTEEVTLLKGYDEPNPNSVDQVKEWLFSLGWVPDKYKEVKDKKTGEKRQVPQINKTPQEGGGLTDSVKELYEKEPNLEELDNYYVLGHRIGILNGFLRDVSGGYVKAKIAGITNTHRMQHAEVVNLPRVDRPYADAVRGSLICEDDEVQVGVDLSSLEDRLKQHFIYPFDPDYVEEMNKDDYDPHLSLAVLAGAITEEQDQNYKSGKDKSIKPIRDIYKNTNYCCQYGAYPPKIAKTANVPLEKGKELFDVYWKKNWAIKEAVKHLIVKEIDGQMWQYNPVSGFWYSLRKMNDQFSTLVQGTASYVFDLFLGYVLSKDRQLTAQFHDEWIKVCKKEDANRIADIAKWAINQVNKKLNLNRQLDIGIQIGTRYSDIH